jgi:hypothetical protein
MILRQCCCRALTDYLAPCTATAALLLLQCSVFDPGSNPNIDRQGSNYYDTVKVRCEAADIALCRPKQ